MTLRNRVDPWGNIHAVAARGSLLGNRGILHDESRQIVRQYQHQSWVTCKLSFKNRKRKIMSPNAYTELFFWMRPLHLQQVIDRVVNAKEPDITNL